MKHSTKWRILIKMDQLLIAADSHLFFVSPLNLLFQLKSVKNCLPSSRSVFGSCGQDHQCARLRLGLKISFICGPSSLKRAEIISPKISGIFQSILRTYKKESLLFFLELVIKYCDDRQVEASIKKITRNKIRWRWNEKNINHVIFERFH